MHAAVRNSAASSYNFLFEHHPDLLNATG
jgi:hypothetical protein